MRSTSRRSTIVTVLAAAFIGIAPMAARAAEYTADAPDELRSDARSNASQCASEPSPLQTSCAATGKDRATKTTSLMQPMAGDNKQTPEQIDVTKTLLEDLIKTEMPQGGRNRDSGNGGDQK